MSDFREVTFSPLVGNLESQDDVQTISLQSPASGLQQKPSEHDHQSADYSQSMKLEAGGSSVWGASFNFVNSIVGAGIIGIPFAIQQCGFIPGMLLLLLVAYLINRSVVMLVECGMRAGKFDLESLAEHLLGPAGYYLAVTSMMLFAYGGMTAYLVILGDTLPVVADFLFGPSFLSQRRASIGFFSTLIVLPLCLMRDLSSLSWTSFLSIFADAVLIVIILVSAASATKEQSEHFQPDDLGQMGITLFAGLGTMSFAFVCQHNSFLVFKSLRQPTLANWKQVAGISLSIAYALCLALGLIGFFAFYPYVEGDLLNNFPASYASVAVARALLAVSMLLTYPMECYVARHCVHSLMRRFAKRKGFNLLSKEQKEAEEEVISFDDDSEAFWKRSASATSSTSPAAPGLVARLTKLFSTKSMQRKVSAHIEISPMQRAYGQPQQHSQPTRSPSGSQMRLSLFLHRDLQSREDVFEDVSLDLSHHSASGRQSITNSSSGIMQQLSSVMTSVVSRSSSDQPIPSPPSMAGNSPQSKRRRYSGLPTHIDPPLLDQMEANREQIVSQSADSKADEVQLHLNNTVHFAAPTDQGDVEAVHQEEAEGDTGIADAISWKEHVIVTMTLWLSTMGIALVAEKLGLVSSLTGVAAASTLGYTLPALIYLKTHRPNTAAMRWTSSFKQFGLPVFMVAFGVTSFFIGIVTVCATA